MSTDKLHNLRSFLTERLTAVAAEVFGEIESILEEYCEENKRLRSVLHMVLSPEIKLHSIDVNQYNGATTGIKVQTPNVEPETSEPLPKIPKEEQIEYDINWESEEKPVLGQADNVITPDCVKNDPEEEEDTSLPRITDSFHIEVIEFNPNLSGMLSADENEDSFDSDSPAASDYPQLSGSEENASEGHKSQEHITESRKSVPSSLQKKMLELPRMMPHPQSFIPTPTECQSFMTRLAEAFKDFPEDKKPLIAKIDLTEDVEFVDCAFGKVPKGCPLSYQCPVPSSRDYKPHDDAPPLPLLPLAHHKLKPMEALPTLSAKEQEHLEVMQITWEAAHSLEHSTRGCKETAEGLRKLRLTSRFREICMLKPGKSQAEHLIFKMQRGLTRCKMAQIEEEMKTEALREYCKHLTVNWTPSGLVVHPYAPWLGALPDGLVYDPKETPCFGLVHVTCVGLQSFIECKFLFCQDGVLQLKRSHRHYWDIQGEMMVTGTDWCDLLLVSREDFLVQRIYRDTAMIKDMKKKLDDFFFYYYLPGLTSTATA